MRVFVYFNLHRKLWSVKALEGPNKGRVVAHRRDVLLRDVTPRVSQAGRQRVLREQRKNVHAGLVGDWHDESFVTRGTYHEVTYNPYKYSGFVYKHNEAEFRGADVALMRDKQVMV